MKIIDLIQGEKPCLSFEVFPPKTWDKFDSVLEAATAIADLKPDFMSVTYGAGGSTARYTAEIGEAILKRGVTPLSHLTCVSADKESIGKELQNLKDRGIENILALRGDIPEGVCKEDLEFQYSSELVKEITEFGGFCIGGACYPETHPESPNSQTDIEMLKRKVEQGCRFLTTQMFFDNHILYNFIYRLYRAGVDVPIVAGIMPVTNAAQIKRICAISKNALPQRFIRIVDRFGDNPKALMQAGIAYATEQVIDLYANGINAVHIYSMNKPEVAKAIRDNLTEIV